MKTKKYALILFLICNSLLILAQNSTMIIYKKDGNIIHIPTNIIDSVTHPLQLPIVTTNNIYNITANSARSEGNIISDRGYFITQRGIVWSTNPNPTLSNNVVTITVNGSVIGGFSCNINNLNANTTYYVRAYAKNSAGTAYGNQVSFKTNSQLANLNTLPISNIGISTAVSGGTITNDDGNGITSRGIVWSKNPSPTINNSFGVINGNGVGSFTINLSDLLPDTKYYIRAFATNSAGTAYGNEVSLKTNRISLATISTNSISTIKATTAISGGNITNDGGGGVIITARGIVWSNNQNPTLTNNLGYTDNGTGTGVFNSNIKDLLANTTYYVRAYATNSAGTAYGNQVSFKTSSIYTIGEKGPAGGLVFYDKGNYNDGWRYLEAAPNDQGYFVWGCNTTAILTSYRIGQGKQNTALIVSGCNESNIAAKTCNDLILGGKDDWFLPSIYELELMYNNLYLKNLGNFSNKDTYWSSSQNGDNIANKMTFGNGQIGQFYKNSSYKVRAVRTF